MYRVGLWRIDHVGALDGVQKGSRLPGYQNRVGPRVSGAGINSRFVTGGIPTASAFGSSSVLVVIIIQFPPGSPSRRGRGTVYIDDPSDMGIFIVWLGGSSLQESVRWIAGIPSNSPPRGSGPCGAGARLVGSLRGPIPYVVLSKGPAAPGLSLTNPDVR